MGYCWQPGGMLGGHWGPFACRYPALSPPPPPQGRHPPPWGLRPHTVPHHRAGGCPSVPVPPPPVTAVPFPHRDCPRRTAAPPVAPWYSHHPVPSPSPDSVTVTRTYPHGCHRPARGHRSVPVLLSPPRVGGQVPRCPHGHLPSSPGGVVVPRRRGALCLRHFMSPPRCGATGLCPLFILKRLFSHLGWP